MLKQLFKFLLFVIIATLLYEVTVANCRHSKGQDYTDFKAAFMSHLNVTNQTIQSSIQMAIDRNWKEYELVGKFMSVFHDQVYWLLVVLLVLICYYEYKSRFNEEISVNSTQKISLSQYEKEKKAKTKIQVDKLMDSEEYRQYIAKKQNPDEVIDIDKEEARRQDAEDFAKNWQTSQEDFFPSD